MSSHSVSQQRATAKLKEALRLYEQALAINPEDALLQQQVARLKALWEEGQVKSAPAADQSEKALFRKLRPGDMKDRETVTKAIQLYEQLLVNDPSNKIVEGTLYLLKERLHSLMKPVAGMLSRGKRRRVDVL